MPRGNVAFNQKEAFVIARKFGADYKGKFVVKAQVQCPSRTLGHFKKSQLRGGVHIVDSIEEVQEMAERMCGKFMSVPGNEHGLQCNSVLIFEKLDVEKEFYFNIGYDTESSSPVITYSSRGGMSFEHIKKRYPASIHSFTVDIQKGLDLNTLLKVAENLDVKEKQSSLVFLVKNLFQAFISRDAEKVMINPLIYSREKHFYAANCCIKIDTAATFRQQEIQSLQDTTQMHYLERAATQAGITYTKLEGSINVMSNGCGTGMAVMDYIAQVGGSCSAVTDFGGKTYHEQIQFAFDMFGMDETSKVLILACTGGMQDMKIIALLVIEAVQKKITKGKPIVIRCKGLSSDLANQLLEEFNENVSEQEKIHICSELDEACEKAVQLADPDNIL